MKPTPPEPKNIPLPNEQAPLPGGTGSREKDELFDDTPEEMVRQFLARLISPGDVFEVRILNCADRRGSTFRSTVSGYYQFSQIERAARDIAGLDASGCALVTYVTLNPVRPSLLGRSVNALRHKAKETTSDGDILRRRWLVVDCDPVRASGISNSNAEPRLAEAKAVRIYLSDSGWSKERERGGHP